MKTNFKTKRWQSKKWRDAAKGQECSMQLPYVCNSNTETTVLCHAPGAGMAVKHSDHYAADMCSSCHDEFDGRTHKGDWLPHELEDYFNDARVRTIVNRIERGIVK